MWGFVSAWFGFLVISLASPATCAGAKACAGPLDVPLIRDRSWEQARGSVALHLRTSAHVLLAGPPGCGKQRLVGEEVAAQGLTLTEVRADTISAEALRKQLLGVGNTVLGDNRAQVILLSGLEAWEDTQRRESLLSVFSL